MKISRCHLADYVEICTKKRAARAARLFFLVQPIKSLICGVFVAVAFVVSGLNFLIKKYIKTGKKNSRSLKFHLSGTLVGLKMPYKIPFTRTLFVN